MSPFNMVPDMQCVKFQLEKYLVNQCPSAKVESPVIVIAVPNARQTTPEPSHASHFTILIEYGS